MLVRSCHELRDFPGGTQRRCVNAVVTTTAIADESNSSPIWCPHWPGIPSLATRYLRGFSASYRHEVDIAKNVECQLPSIRRNIQIHGGALSGFEHHGTTTVYTADGFDRVIGICFGSGYGGK